MTQVMAYSTTTGKKRMIPEHWLTTDAPNIAGRFKLTPVGRLQQAREGDPEPSWTIAQLTEWATTNAVDLGDAKLHDDIYDVVAAHISHNGPAGTPPAGDE